MNLNLTDKEISLLITALNHVYWEKETNVEPAKTSMAVATRVERKLTKALDEHPDTEFE